MKKLFTLITTASLLVVVLNSCNKENAPVPGSDSHREVDVPAIDVIVEEVPLAGFNDVVNNTNVDVVVVPDADYSMVVEATDVATLAEITPIISGGTLTVDAPAAVTDATIYVHTPVIGTVRVNKNGNMRTSGNYSQLNVEVKGNGSSTLTGTTTGLSVMGGGNGNVDALGMPAIDVVVNMKGNSVVRVAAQATLNVDLSGNAKVYYTGNPVIIKKLKGNAKLIKLY